MGTHPGYAVGCWLQEYKEQVWLFTREFAVGWTRNSAERAVKRPEMAPGRLRLLEYSRQPSLAGPVFSLGFEGWAVCLT